MIESFDEDNLAVALEDRNALRDTFLDRQKKLVAKFHEEWPAIRRKAYLLEFRAALNAWLPMDSRIPLPDQIRETGSSPKSRLASS